MDNKDKEREELKKLFREAVEKREQLRDDDMIEPENPDKFMGAPGVNDDGTLNGIKKDEDA